MKSDDRQTADAFVVIVTKTRSHHHRPCSHVFFLEIRTLLIAQGLPPTHSISLIFFVNEEESSKIHRNDSNICHENLLAKHPLGPRCRPWKYQCLCFAQCAVVRLCQVLLVTTDDRAILQWKEEGLQAWYPHVPGHFAAGRQSQVLLQKVSPKK